MSPDLRTPVRSKNLDASLLFSSPPAGTELRQANAVLNYELSSFDNVSSPVKRYTARMTRAFESTQSELVTLRKRLAVNYRPIGSTDLALSLESQVGYALFVSDSSTRTAQVNGFPDVVARYLTI